MNFDWINYWACITGSQCFCFVLSISIAINEKKLFIIIIIIIFIRCVVDSIVLFAGLGKCGERWLWNHLVCWYRSCRTLQVCDLFQCCQGHPIFAWKMSTYLLVNIVRILIQSIDANCCLFSFENFFLSFFALIAIHAWPSMKKQATIFSRYVLNVSGNFQEVIFDNSTE